MKSLMLLAAAAAAVPPVATPALAPLEIVAAAPAADWVDIAPSDLLVMDLAGDRRVVIQLMPPPFSQGWIGNIRKLAAARWYDGTSINRVQDNYVVQWGDADSEDKAKAKIAPDLRVPHQDNFIAQLEQRTFKVGIHVEFATNPRIFSIATPDKQRKEDDPYSRTGVGFALGWPVGHLLYGNPFAWPIHCYGMVGVGRDMPPDTGTGAELYTVIGHAPRHLDRNIALVGRVIAGIEHLSSLPRGTGPLGFYEKAEQRVPIVSVRMGSDVSDLPRFQYLSTESASFARYADARANRRDPFFIMPAGGADICNIPVPVRAAK